MTIKIISSHLISQAKILNDGLSSISETSTASQDACFSESVGEQEGGITST